MSSGQYFGTGPTWVQALPLCYFMPLWVQSLTLSTPISLSESQEKSVKEQGQSTRNGARHIIGT